MIVLIYFPECEESDGQSAVDRLTGMLIFALRCRRIISVAEMEIYSELSIAFDTCFEANREIIHTTKRKGTVIF